MRDGPGRRAVKWVARGWFYALMLPQRRARQALGLIEWELAGGCQRSGLCCERPTMRAERIVRTVPLARRVFLWWQERVNGFTLTEETADGLLRFRCSHFDAATRGCDSYDSRPGMCRDYPRPLLTATTPRFIDGCGYRAVARNSDTIRSALAESDLPPEKIRELEEKLGAR